VAILNKKYLELAKGWQEGMDVETTKEIAYLERNLLALLLAKSLNDSDIGTNGWYVHGEWVGWSRVVSILDGSITFHVPDDFDLGDLPQIDSNYDGHTTEEKWKFVMGMVGIKHDS
jgi:hypothetical protein